MKKFEILEHPAELRLRIYGKTIEELFINATEAMAQILSLATKFEIKNQKSTHSVKASTERFDRPERLAAEGLSRMSSGLILSPSAVSPSTVSSGLSNCSGPNCETEVSKIKIKVESVDINSLLVDFLSEILAKSQINKVVYQVLKIKYQKLKESVKLEAEILGYLVEQFDEDIKAVTYQDLDIKKVNSPSGGWQTEIVFDI